MYRMIDEDETPVPEKRKHGKHGTQHPGFATTGKTPMNHPRGAYRGGRRGEPLPNPTNVTPAWVTDPSLLPKKPPGKR